MNNYINLPSGAGGDATAVNQVIGNTSLNSINAKTPALGQQLASASSPVVLPADQIAALTLPTATPLAARNAKAIVTTPTPQVLFRPGFSNSYASSVDPLFWTSVNVGTNQNTSQSSGNLVLTAGTTANAETILRSTSSFSGNLILRAQTTLGQRIANNNFFVELVDVIGDNLVASASSATSLTVTIPNNPFTTTNVGQSMYIGALASGLVGVPGRYAIASVSGNNVTFTVSGFTIGTGTVSLFGWNYYQATYTGTTATLMNYDAQRRGWNSGVGSVNINSTGSPGHMLILNNEDGNAFVSDQLTTSTTSIPLLVRGSRVVNLPEENTQLYLQIRVLNGSTAPATTTSWTIGTISVENYVPTGVSITGVKAQGQGSGVPVTMSGGTLGTVGTITAVTGVTTVSTVNTVAAITNANLGFPVVVADITSAAISSSTTTAAFTPSSGPSYQINIPVTVVSGTNPTLDVQIQEARDFGTNWVAIYDFPRITATGSYTSPVLPLTGNRLRYVQTLGGTTPSFTRQINRVQQSISSSPAVRQLIDRTIVLTTLGSSTATLNVENNTTIAQLVVNIGAASSAPILQLQASDDGGTSWYNVGATLTAVASSTVSLTIPDVTAQLFRATVTSAGTGVTAGYVLVKAF